MTKSPQGILVGIALVQFISAAIPGHSAIRLVQGYVHPTAEPKRSAMLHDEIHPAARPARTPPSPAAFRDQKLVRLFFAREPFSGE